ncbi:MAG TPA: hypothetical protein VK000_06180 [Luteimonas sp.]|nr:hypothetical protein [Luteimonas sp.]
MSFDPLQREFLAAMGHTVYVLHDPRRQDDADRALADRGIVTRVTAPATASGADPDVLLLALLRAAGRAPDDAEALALCRSLLSAAGLPHARARRALWPRLRALRAGAASR